MKFATPWLLTALAFASVAPATPASPRANVPPVSEDDVYRIEVDAPLTVPAPGVLDNDTDDNHDALTVILEEPPGEGGTLELRSDGSFDYSPPPGYVGKDEFKYRAFDGIAYGNVAGVTIEVGLGGPAVATYTDETLYLADLADLGLVPQVEGFEDDTAWGAARSPFTQPEVVSSGIAWTANNPDSQVTSGPGPVRTGTYGFFCLPHGNYATGTDCHIPGNCTDGWIATGRGSFYAAGGWIEGSGNGKIEFILDGQVIDFGGDTFVSNAHRFLGMIVEAGFQSFEVHELEGKAEDQKLLFADDFTFGVPALVQLDLRWDRPFGEVALDWWGGAGPFTVYRSTDPSTVVAPENILGETTRRSWADAPPTGGLFFYRVTSP